MTRKFQFGPWDKMLPWGKMEFSHHCSNVEKSKIFFTAETPLATDDIVSELALSHVLQQARRFFSRKFQTWSGLSTCSGAYLPIVSDLSDAVSRSREKDPGSTVSIGDNDQYRVATSFFPSDTRPRDRRVTFPISEAAGCSALRLSTGGEKKDQERRTLLLHCWSPSSLVTVRRGVKKMNGGSSEMDSGPGNFLVLLLAGEQSSRRFGYQVVRSAVIFLHAIYHHYYRNLVSFYHRLRNCWWNTDDG